MVGVHYHQDPLWLLGGLQNIFAQGGMVDNE
jgi:hypothetical protein